MVQINTVTLLDGRSAFGQKKENTLPIKTTEGQEYYHRKVKLIREAKKSGNYDFYINHLKQEFDEVEQELSTFLYDDTAFKKYKMDEDDTAGWNIYHNMLDRYTICKYFLQSVS